MKYMGLNEIRKLFTDFWVSKEHYARGSYSLVPEKDKSLLLIAAGMAPLKPYFSGAEVPPAKRMTTCQKCVRTNDIDNVGHTARHATFFEMLGNFSFGDYFKKDAIPWAWEFATKYLGLPEDRIWVTIYLDDDEAREIWLKTGVPDEHIVRLGKEDNFWEIGQGPCGPCSELHYDRGPEFGCGKPDCKPGCDCDRFLEFWNLVFTQFDKQEDGSYVPLAHPNIDTGMGLERMACIMQGVDSIYAVDTMKSILNEVVRISGTEYKDGKGDYDVSIRVVTDHIRTACFMIADGILPSNEGRGYILRRVLRRAARHGRLLGVKGKFLVELSNKVMENYGEAYPELITRKDYIQKIIGIEEDKFAQTIEQGLGILDQYIADNKAENKTVLTGEQAFKLYDTFGFPFEVTKEIAEEAGFTVDEEGFKANMQAQKAQARAARKDDDNNGWLDDSVVYNEFPKTQFLGYETGSAQAKLVGIVSAAGSVKTADEGEEVKLVLDATPFYGESGGQIGDHGTIKGDGFTAEITDTVRKKDVFVHSAKITSGQANVGDEVTAAICPFWHNSVARNHTATHMLQKALQTVLGDHVAQAGSLVTAGSLRFDFTHFEAISKEDLAKIEDMVNVEILKFTPVTTQVLPIEEANKLGAMHLFGEKYGETVRVVSIGDYSMEFCGGTHVSNVGQIGCFKIISESGVAAGTRRIEAITGDAVRKLLNKEQTVISNVAASLKSNAAGLEKKAEDTAAEIKALKKEIEEMKAKAAAAGASDMMAGAKQFGEARLICKQFEGAGVDQLRSISDSIKAAEKNVVLVMADVNGPKATIMVSVTDDLVGKGYHAGNMVKEIAKAAGGGGGGKADMAQAGAKDISKLPEAFAVAEKLMESLA